MTTTDEFEKSSYLFGANSGYIAELFEKFIEDPQSVDDSWREFFAELGEDSQKILADMRGAPWKPRGRAIIGQQADAAASMANGSAGGGVVIGRELMQATSQDSLHANMMIRVYRVRGHLMAELDPLGLEPAEVHPELDPAAYGFREKDYNREIFLDGVLGKKSATVGEIINTLKRTYCGHIGVEFMHIQYPDQKAWVQKRVEKTAGKPKFSVEEKKEILKGLIEVESFEQFLHVKYPGTKRFSIKGGDAAIVGIETILQTAAQLGVENIEIGMPHRGRMNVITQIMAKPYAELLSIFHGNLDFPEWVESSGDVKYHLGVSSDRIFAGDKKVHLSLASNPSHLEAVNAVVLGKSRSKIDHYCDGDKRKVMSITMHGDAAFAGQGSVAEALSLSELRGYRTGGSIHIIVNNQIGFTTSPKNSRFTPYPSDVAKMIQAPIFHVNGDDPEAVAYVCKLATEFRQKFGRDVVVDIFCYRKYGHNEGDEPMFTQPLMYKKIKKHKSQSEVYAEQLKAEGVLTQEDVDGIYESFKTFFEREYDAAKNFRPNKANWLEGSWKGLEKPGGDEHPAGDTGVSKDVLKRVGKALTSYPEGFNINSKIARQLKAKEEMLSGGEGFDWAMGEALAFGTLVDEGHPVRLSGQDCERGTFSHRHSVLIDQENEDRYTPLNHISDAQAHYEVINSSLSEFAVLAFEYGYSLALPQGLTIWEAQFGDFANGAQVIIDQFISSGEIKWLRMSGLVMLLPHGYEGQGPEHSSARFERFLQLCGEDNMQVVNCTTPANYFHVLRRQIHRNFRKPLIIMTPKSLLRHKRAVSTLDDFTEKEHFKRVIADDARLDSKVKRVIFCTGKVYYDLLEAREEKGITNIALVRLEQIYPFPAREVKAQLEQYKDAEIMWCQEEPENMGAWRFVGPRIGDVLDGLGRDSVKISYAGRKEAASPAAGYLKIHEAQQKALIEEALTL